jgi:hypothetical protein
LVVDAPASVVAAALLVRLSEPSALVSQVGVVEEKDVIVALCHGFGRAAQRIATYAAPVLIAATL